MQGTTMNTVNAASKSSKFLNFKQVSDRIGLSRSPLYRRIRAGTFPKPVKLGAMSRWVESEINDWMTAQVIARDGSLLCVDEREPSGKPA
jgi:prophage regulatory protein